MKLFHPSTRRTHKVTPANDKFPGQQVTNAGRCQKPGPGTLVSLNYKILHQHSSPRASLASSFASLLLEKTFSLFHLSTAFRRHKSRYPPPCRPRSVSTKGARFPLINSHHTELQLILLTYNLRISPSETTVYLRFRLHPPPSPTPYRSTLIEKIYLR